MLDKQLARAIADVALFLEMSGDEIVDPDAAIGAMEQLAHNLQHASIEVQRDLTSHLVAIAPDYSDQKNFVAGLPDALGLSG